MVLGHGQIGHVLLGELALVGQHGRSVGQQAGRLDVHGTLGDLPLNPLEVRDGLAEGGALLDVLGGVHERALGQPDAAGGHDRAHGVEPEHGQAEPAHLADDVLGRHVDVAEQQLASVDPLDAHFVVGPAHLDPVPRPLDDEGGDRVMGPAGRVRGLGEHGVPVRLAHSRHPALGAVEHPAAVGALVGHAPGPHPHDVTARLGLGQPERRPQGPVADTGQVALLLCLGAGDHDRARGQTGQQQHQRSRVGVLGDLFNGQRQAEDAGPGASELDRNAQPQQAGVAERVENIARVRRLLVDGARPGLDLVLCETPDRITERQKLVGKFEMHRCRVSDLPARYFLILDSRRTGVPPAT